MKRHVSHLCSSDCDQVATDLNVFLVSFFLSLSCFFYFFIRRYLIRDYFIPETSGECLQHIKTAAPVTPTLQPESLDLQRFRRNIN